MPANRPPEHNTPSRTTPGEANSKQQPACNACRKRKSRCAKQDGTTECVMCQVYGTECSTQDPTRFRRVKTPRLDRVVHTSPNTPHPALHQPNQDVQRISETAGDHAQSHTEHTGTTDANAVLTQLNDHGAHVVSPAIGEDSDELERYVSSNRAVTARSITRTSTDTGLPRLSRPVFFNTVLRRPLGVNENQSAASRKCTIIEKLVEPYAPLLIDLYLENANICCPVLDPASFRQLYDNQRDHLSPALLSNIYANALTYWKLSPALRSSPMPDHRFIWVQANEALHSELFLAPGISTVIAIILNVCGRPSTSRFGNGGLLGAAIAISNSLGLNRDPTAWNISLAEKRFRVRIWWMLVILDRWASLANGTPLQIHRAQFDVPMITLDHVLQERASNAHIKAGKIFVALQSLTVVLGLCLESMYSVSTSWPDAVAHTTLDLERKLTEWEDSLSDDVRRLALRGTQLDTPGAANFRLAYLAVKLVLYRLHPRGSQLNWISSTTRTPGDTRAVRVAEEIVHLVEELGGPQISGFWMPTNAFTLTSATLVLLRDALKPTNSDRHPSLSLARMMIDRLRKLRRDLSWDLATDCLHQCAGSLDKIEAGSDPISVETADFQAFVNAGSNMLDDLFGGFGNAFETDLEESYDL